MQFEDVVYEKNEGIATITMNRPQVRNAFRTLTVDELIAAFQDAWWDHSIGVVIFTGAGDKAFCAGGDQSERSAEGYDTSSAGHEMDECRRTAQYYSQYSQAGDCSGQRLCYWRRTRAPRSV